MSAHESQAAIGRVPGGIARSRIFLNHKDLDLSRRAVAVALGALDYATAPWYLLSHSGRLIRTQAAKLLGELQPLYREPGIFARLARVMEEDGDPDVRNAAYTALMRLASAPEETLLSTSAA
jgi:hypothetical protein